MNQPSAVGSSDSKVLARVPREGGYGDFSFGRILYSNRVKAMFRSYGSESPLRYILLGEKEVWMDEDFASQSNNARFVELGGYQRTGSFPFAKVPTEIRHRILRVLLAPFFRDVETMKQTVVDFRIDNRCFCYKYNDYFEGGNREYLAKFIDRRAPDLSIDPLHGLTPLEGFDSMAIEDRLQVEKRYADLKRAYQFDSSRHPERISQHEIMARAYKEDRNTSALEEMNVNFLIVELVRHLSNVSTTMRQDFGSVLFARTALHISENALTTSGPISCLMSRPAIHKGIKFLKLSFSCTSCDTYRADFDQFKVACQYLSNILELTHLSIYIDVGNIVLESEQKEMEDLCRGAGRYSGLDIIRSIQVTKQFQIYFVDRRYYVLWEDPWKDSDEERYQGRIEDFLRPNTLRNSAVHSTQVTTDEKTKYFQPREE